MNKATRMLLYLGLGLVAVLLGLVLFWYVQTRNVEIARYEVLDINGDVEIRAYPALVVAEVTRTGNRDEAVRSGFGPLARYIFAKERPGEDRYDSPGNPEIGREFMDGPVHHAIRLSAGPLAKAIRCGCSATRTAPNAPRGDPLQRMVVG